MQIIKYIIIFLPIILYLGVFILSLTSKDKELIKDGLILIPCMALVNLLYAGLLFVIFTRIDTEVILQNKIEFNLVATKFGNIADGNFFLGTGSIDNEEYMYYVIREGNEIKREKTQDYKIYVVNEVPKVIVEKKVVRRTFKNWLYSINDIEEEVVNGECVFYVPENSIVQNININ